MRIAIFTDTFPPEVNGAAIAVYKMSNQLAQQGHNVLIFVPRHGKEPHMHKNVTLVRFKAMSLPSYKDFFLAVPTFPRVRKAIKAFQPDVIHTQMPGPIGFTGVAVAKAFKLPLVGTYHTKLDDFVKHLSLLHYFGAERFFKLKHPIKEKVSWDYTRLFYNRCNLVTAPTKVIRDMLKQKRVKSKVVVLSNGLDIHTYKKKKSYRAKKKILHFGRLSYEKNTDVIIKAMQYLPREITLDIVGKGPDVKALKRLTKQLQLQKRVFFLGPVHNSEVNELCTNYDFFVTASTIETQCLAMLEAMASGLPIVGVKMLALNEIVSKKSGILVKPGDEKALAKAMHQLTRNEKLRSSMGKEARKIAEKHDLKKVSKELLSLYKRAQKIKSYS